MCLKNSTTCSIGITNKPPTKYSVHNLKQGGKPPDFAWIPRGPRAKGLIVLVSPRDGITQLVRQKKQ